MMKRIVKDPEVRKREIIDTAERLFMAKGFEQTAISEIVHEINISQGTFYYYFDSKEDVLIAVLEKEVADMERDLIRIADQNDLDEAVKLNTMINRFISITASGKKILSYIHQGKNSTLQKKLMNARPFHKIAPIMGEVISDGAEKGRFNTARPIETSYLLIILLASVLHMIFLPKTSGRMRDSEKEGMIFRENMRLALEDLLSRTLEASDYKFSLQI
jgi:AcrR family transcriptional regulator